MAVERRAVRLAKQVVAYLQQGGIQRTRGGFHNGARDRCPRQDGRAGLSSSNKFLVAYADSSRTHEQFIEAGGGGKTGVKHSIYLIQYFHTIVTNLTSQLLYRSHITIDLSGSHDQSGFFRFNKVLLLSE